MFVFKENLIEAFKQIHLLYSKNPDELTKQGCTQFFSGMRYFLATSAFEKRNMKSAVDSTDFQDKSDFIKYVGELVSINEEEYTCNFYNDFKQDEDYKVGSNFFSAGFIDDSRKNPTVVYEYPSRDKSNIILKASNGKFEIAEAGLTAFKRKYLERENFKYALVIWLIRNENIESESLSKEYVESFLMSRYTEDVANALMPQDDSFLTRVKLVAEKAMLTSKELSFSEKPTVKENGNGAGLKKSDVKEFKPSQIIYYGVPGCGKSKKITDLLEAAKQNGEIADEESQVERVVFHPEYTNADFVGQVMPVVKPGEGVNYDFVAGPFSRILARAYANPAKPYFLIIEEINRGNAASIFGEIFQLLDRHKKGESDSVGGNTYTAGWSKYFVNHVDVNGIIRKEISASDYTTEEKPVIHFTANTAIRLPPNFSIYATMNTCDQNVFTLDNAFKRRFDSELIQNSLDGENHREQRETKIEGTNVTWGEFWAKINELILDNHSSMTSTEDKRLGAYFIVGEEKCKDGLIYREISKKLFGEKVLEYLWNDAFKYKRKNIFQDDCKSIEQLVEKFISGGFSDVFKDVKFQESVNEC